MYSIFAYTTIELGKRKVILLKKLNLQLYLSINKASDTRCFLGKFYQTFKKKKYQSNTISS